MKNPFLCAQCITSQVYHLYNKLAVIEHCLEWGRDHFNEYFTDIITDTKKWVESPEDFYKDLVKEGNITLQLEKLNKVKEHLLLAQSNSFDKCIEFAVKEFTDNYYYKIRQLLYNFPADYTNDDGSKFWTGSKRVPHPIKYDSKDELSFAFVKNFAIILARTLSIPANKDDEYIKSVADKIEMPEFVPKTIKIKIKDTDPDTNSAQGNEQQIIDQIKAEIQNIKLDASKIVPEEFEKDDDSNGHIDFIHACSNVRAANYKIEQSDRLKTQRVAGKIIPAIATTTASITGVVSLQLYTLLQTDKMEFYRNCFLNLGINLIIMTEPEAVIHIEDKEYDEMLLGPVKAIPPKFTVWDKIVVDGSKTVGEFIKFIKEKYNVDVSVITCGGVTIVQTFMPSNKNRMNQKIEDIYSQNCKSPLLESKKSLFLEVSGDCEGASALMPLFKYNFKK